VTAAREAGPSRRAGGRRGGGTGDIWTRVIAPAALLIALPLVVYYLWICLAYYRGGLVLPRSAKEWAALAGRVPAPSLSAAGILLAWFLYLAAAHLVVPGRRVEGLPQDDGARLTYKTNGWATWWATWALLGLAVWSGWLRPSTVTDRFGSLLSTANILVFILAVCLFVAGRRRSADRGKPDWPLHEFFAGTSLNPRINGFDWKFFCETRPGLIGWVAIDLALLLTQYHRHGRVSAAMALVVAFHFWYVADCMFNEAALLSTWDIRHERFGWMLCWGDLVWVPATYPIQAWYLVDRPGNLAPPAIAAIVGLNTVGYVIFRDANIQKHRFRQDPAKPIWRRQPEYIATRRGGLLLVSGWWGFARHANYLGDMLMALAWCLPCGFGSALPYFYLVYLTALLVHRERRDDRACAEKYGHDWQAYRRRVRYRIVPGVY
jgi:delta14-sterol reductase